MTTEFTELGASLLPRNTSIPSYLSNPDRFLKLAQQADYVHEVWWFMASVIGALAVFHYCSVFLQACSSGESEPSLSSSTGTTSGEPLSTTIRSGKISLRRLPAAINSTIRIVLFRWTVPIGTNAVASVSELIFIFGYIGALLIWEFVHTKDLETYLWEDRAAHLASCQIPLVIALAGKNNIIGLLTGRATSEDGVVKCASSSRRKDIGITTLGSWHGSIFIICGFIHAREPGCLRFLRIIFLNRIWLGSHRTQASVELLSPDTVRLTLRRKMSWKPGQHIYLNMPGISAFPGELHPFTISSIPTTNGEEGSKLVFIIKARDGLTRRLRDYATKNSDPVNVFVDGPYGCPPDFNTSSTAILFAGGSGITFILPLLADIIRRAKERRTVTKRVLWVWTVRDAGHVEWIQTVLADVCSKLPDNITVDAQIYVTGLPGSHSSFPKRSDLDAHTPSTVSTEEKDSTAFDSNSSFPCYQVKEGRPNIKALLEEAIDLSEDSVAVGVAGPPQLAQTVRKSLRFSSPAGPSAVLKGGPLVTLHTETFGTSVIKSCRV
ncbi:hypothetical protein Clacol_001467 [Clathrus columnatus]|uniref:ferric-chelate reductase (NADPH) n=1 Tax=Clathrus columnatus TaxID=1419009 RepID=A0AAV5A106_9AGAM|nr:hypothetical protein Clacol_001467 [Clathrus columnatus]